MIQWFKNLLAPVPRMQVARIKPGDTLVLTYAGRLTSNQRDVLVRALKMSAPVDVKCLILDGGMELNVLSEACHQS
ncbi:MAG: hypothetical protein K0R43_1713 [Pseudoduganella sp.]|nr:hypothetical protein [Pseudoduganella sp.]